MIIGIGCDIIEHSLIRKMRWKSDKQLLTRLFTTLELKLYLEKKTINFIAGRFAAKEAVLKCLKIGMRDGIAMTDIEIGRDKSGQPSIKLKGELKRIAQKTRIKLWHISITHSAKTSLAFVVAESNL